MMLRTHHLRKTMILLYIFLFFAYLFGPLLIMAITAFNSAEFPRISPWDCFTTQWFEQMLNDERLISGFQRSLIIGIIVTVSATLLGLAGALMLMQVPDRARPAYYTVLISPILIPGVVLGISTLIFWDRIRLLLGLSADSIFYDGLFLTIMGQTTFIASYCMLIFIARLQRFDRSLEEAALDLGATQTQTFFKILVPFLKPAFGSAAVIAFLASFENYNTTVFTILSKSTLTTELASKLRFGINPSISALAVIIISVTLCGAIIFEILKRREERLTAAREATAKQAERMELAGKTPVNEVALTRKSRFDGAIASVVIVLIIFSGISTYMLSNAQPNSVCQADLKTEKLERQRQIQEETERRLEEERRLNGNVDDGSSELLEESDKAYNELFESQGLENLFNPNSLPAPTE